MSSMSPPDDKDTEPATCPSVQKREVPETKPEQTIPDLTTSEQFTLKLKKREKSSKCAGEIVQL